MEEFVNAAETKIPYYRMVIDAVPYLGPDQAIVTSLVTAEHYSIMVGNSSTARCTFAATGSNHYLVTNDSMTVRRAQEGNTAFLADLWSTRDASS